MKVHLIGIGGTGMGALAGLLKASGHDVRGSDEKVYPPMSDQLEALGIPYFEGFSPSNLDWGPDKVVVGNVCRPDHIEVRAAQDKKLTLVSFPQVLGEEFLAQKRSLVVSGTHGKTTTAAILTHILLEAGRDPSCFIGGVPLNFGQGWRLGAGKEFVVEGDEYDSAFFDKGSKFLHYRPEAAILTSVELDHVDIFASFDAVKETFRKFLKLIPKTGYLVVAADEEAAVTLARSSASCKVETYAVDGDDNDVTLTLEEGVAAELSPKTSNADWVASDLEYLQTGRCAFELRHRGEFFERFETILAGTYNIANVVAAIAIAHSQGVPTPDIKAAIGTFAGVKRRQEIRGLAQGVYVIDDYAHHPTSVERTLMGLRKRFPGRRLVALYEPRSATSRRRVFQNQFALALSQADAVVIGKPYDTSRISEADRFNAEEAAQAVRQAGARAVALANVDEIVKHVAELVRPGDVVIVFSSGTFGGIHDRLLSELGDAVIPANRKDVPTIVNLLKDLSLDWQDVDAESGRKFLCLHNEHGIVGVVGLEVFGEEAVLRSLGVKKEHRGAGYGWMLADTVIDFARRRGVRRIYLVTETASDFFGEKHGFRVVDSSTISRAVTQSRTFQQRSGKQVAMRLDL